MLEKVRIRVEVAEKNGVKRAEMSGSSGWFGLVGLVFQHSAGLG